jgi:hypothetical protein
VIWSSSCRIKASGIKPRLSWRPSAAAALVTQVQEQQTAALHSITARMAEATEAARRMATAVAVAQQLGRQQLAPLVHLLVAAAVLRMV